MKKLLALLLALMMFAPVLSMAEGMDDLDDLGELDSMIGDADGPTSIFVTDASTLTEAALAAGRRIDTVLTMTALNGIQTGDPTIDTAIADLLDALALRFSSQGDEGDMAVVLSGQDVVNIGGLLSGEDLYINSNLLGGTIVVGTDEVEPLLGRLLDMFVLMGAMTEDEAAEIKAILAEATAGVEQNLASAMPSDLSMEDLDFSALMDMTTELMAKVTEVENPVVPKMCDPAVAGVQMTLTNADMQQMVKAIFQFLLDNPALLDYLTVTMELSADMVKEAIVEVENETLLGGDMIVAVYVGEDDGIVYATLNLPHYEDGVTTQIDAAYTRQTVSAGVSHVVNMTVDGATATFDALASDGQFTANLYAADGTKALDLTVKTAENALAAELNAYDGEEKVFSVALEGECEYTDVREYFAGVLTITPYENGQAIPMVFRLTSDYAIDGVDFTGVGGFSFEGMGFEVGVQLASQTGAAQESIMAGDVTRPAELDDTAFQNWFVGVVNGLAVTLTNAMTALPESVLTLLISSGM